MKSLPITLLAAGVLAIASAPVAAAAAPQDEVTFRGRTGADKYVPDHPPSDEVLAGRVREALEHDEYIGGQDIDVDVRRGVAILSKDAATPFDRSRAEIVASRVPDIVGVISRLTVAKPENGGAQSDAELLADVRNELYWNPEIDLDDVQVSVEDGVVSLRGTVDSYRTRGAIVDEARSAGAARIQNRLAVEGDEAHGAASQGQ